jgi:phosphoribosylamine--glycine ligase
VKIIVVGSGGREHAIAWKLLESPQVKQVFCIPGNGGTALLNGCENIDLSLEDFDGIAQIAQENEVDLVVVGPELPLAGGITDYLQQQNITVFGPNRVGAQIEASKAWAKSLMEVAQVPTARSRTFTEIAPAIAYIQEQGAPIVVKADGLAAGKGVIVALTETEALGAVEELFASGFSKLIIEEFLAGEEVSVLVLTDGIDYRCLLPAQDHKRIGEGDTGKNTGGMGAYAPAPLASPELMQRLEIEVLKPILQTLQKGEIDYRGVLYVGLMITPLGELKVLEFNCRFGDPETQAILPLLETPLVSVLLACAQQRLGELPPLQWYTGSSVCVVAASAGYPDNYEKGQPISGIDVAEATGAKVFQAGTVLKSGEIRSDGGRVLGITAIAPSFEQALEKVYQAMNLIHFQDIYYRRDIGSKLKSSGQ